MRGFCLGIFADILKPTMPAEKPKTFVIIDANALIHRSYHALPRLTTRKGELVNAVFGFTSVLLKVLREMNPEYIAAAFDVAGPTFREKVYKEYKAKRVKAPQDLYDQMPRVKEVLEAFHIPVYEHQGFEADDVIGTLVAQAPKKFPLPTDQIPLEVGRRSRPQVLTGRGMEIIIVTGDLDALQLVNAYTKVYSLRKGFGDTVLYGEKEVRARYGLEPEQLADYRGLRGDPSDNIIGVPGIGEKTATELLQQFGTIEGLYSAVDKKDEKKLAGVKPRTRMLLEEHKDDAFFSKMLATIRRDAPVKFALPAARWHDYDMKHAEDLLKDLGFFTLAKRLPSKENTALVSPVQSASAPPKEGNEKKEKNQSSLFVTANIEEEIERAYKDGIFSEKIYNMEKEVVPVLRKMEERGIRLDNEVLVRLQKKVEKELAGHEKNIFRVCKMEFNINSPQQMAKVLFAPLPEGLGISAKGIGKTPGGEISTAAPELEKLKGEHPAIDMILSYRELQKLLSTYVLPLQELPDAQSRIHTSFRQLGAATGRLSSANPNLQNIPLRTDLGKEIRRAFVPSPGNIFFSADYSQMELRIVAHLAQDKEMIATFQRGEDIHRHTAAVVFGVPEENVTPQMRFRAKALNFGLIYGIGVVSFARSAEMSRKDAKDFMERYMQVFQGVAAYMEQTKRSAHQKGYVETLWGRRRYLPDLDSPNIMLRRAAERAAINMPVQGTAADIVKRAMVEAGKKLPQISLLLQVHDELLWEGEREIVAKAAPAVRTILEGVVELSVPLTVDLRTGFSWCDLHPFS